MVRNMDTYGNILQTSLQFASRGCYCCSVDLLTILTNHNNHKSRHNQSLLELISLYIVMLTTTLITTGSAIIKSAVICWANFTANAFLCCTDLFQQVQRIQQVLEHLCTLPLSNWKDHIMTPRWFTGLLCCGHWMNIVFCCENWNAFEFILTWDLTLVMFLVWHVQRGSDCSGALPAIWDWDGTCAQTWGTPTG